MSKVTIDGLPMTVPQTETLARNRALWPCATADAPKEEGEAEEKDCDK